PQHIDESSQSDPILVRADGSYLYTLPSVVDDIDLAISHVVRGNDHVTNTAAQIQLFEALGARPPRFAHLPLLTDAVGAGLSKRIGSLSIGELRASGIEAMAINSYLARIGTADAIEANQTLDELAAGFELGKFGRASPKFDEVELRHLNARVLHGLSYPAVRERLAALGLSQVDEALWNAASGNIGRLDEIGEWLAVCHGPVVPAIDDAVFANAAADLLPSEPWDGATWSAWTGAVKTATGRKGKELFRPLRLALTARDHGPEMKDLLPLIGRAKALTRLRGQSA
ncbi:MAG: glutamate--tRNA ligase, partial [Methylocella sp.]